jgi:hypothetical protein
LENDRKPVIYETTNLLYVPVFVLFFLLMSLFVYIQIFQSYRVGQNYWYFEVVFGLATLVFGLGIVFPRKLSFYEDGFEVKGRKKVERYSYQDIEYWYFSPGNLQNGDRIWIKVRGRKKTIIAPYLGTNRKLRLNLCMLLEKKVGAPTKKLR